MAKREKPREGEHVTFVIPIEGVQTTKTGVVQDLLDIQFTILAEGGGVWFRFYTDDDWQIVDG